MVTDVVEHPVSRGAVAGVEHLQRVYRGSDHLLLPHSSHPGQPSQWRSAQSPPRLLRSWSSEHLITEPRAGFYLFFLITNNYGQSNQEKSPKSRHGL